MEMDCQFISIYGKLVTSQTTYFTRADISTLADTGRLNIIQLDIFKFQESFKFHVFLKFQESL